MGSWDRISSSIGILWFCVPLCLEIQILEGADLLGMFRQLHFDAVSLFVFISCSFMYSNSGFVCCSLDGREVFWFHSNYRMVCWTWTVEFLFCLLKSPVSPPQYKFKIWSGRGRGVSDHHQPRWYIKYIYFLLLCCL